MALPRTHTNSHDDNNESTQPAVETQSLAKLDHITIKITPAIQARLAACIEELDQQHACLTRKHDRNNYKFLASFIGLGMLPTATLCLYVASSIYVYGEYFVGGPNDPFFLLPHYDQTKLPNASMTAQTCGMLYPMNKTVGNWNFYYPDQIGVNANRCHQSYEHYQNIDLLLSLVTGMSSALLFILSYLFFQVSMRYISNKYANPTWGSDIKLFMLPASLQSEVRNLANETGVPVPYDNNNIDNIATELRSALDTLSVKTAPIHSSGFLLFSNTDGLSDKKEKEKEPLLMPSPSNR